MTKTYQIVKTYTICGEECECLCCDIATASGVWCICYDEEQAKKRVAELHEAGHTSARYEEVPEENQWWNDPTNF